MSRGITALFLACFAFLAPSLQAQSTGAPGGLLGPGGEAIIGGAEGGWTVTPTTVYYNTNISSYPGHFNIASKYHARIVSIVQKQTSPPLALVLLSNGLVIQFHATIYSPGPNTQVAFTEFPIGKVTETGSNSWEKVAGDAIYALSSSFLHVSRDSGATWPVDSTGLNGTHVWDFALDTAQYVYAATDNGLFKQHPDSSIWHPVTSLTQITSLFRVFVDRQDRILVGGNGSGLYMSTDNGASWFVDTTGLGGASPSLMADDPFHNLYAVVSSRLYKSAGGTSAWQLTDGDIAATVVNSYSINGLCGDSTLRAGTSFGVFKSTDQGTTWTMDNSNIRAEKFNGFLMSPNGRQFASSSLGIYWNNPPDTVWSKSYPVSGYAGGLPLYGDDVGDIFTTFGASSKGGPYVYRSTDNGTSWNIDTAGVYALQTGVFYVDEAGTQHVGTSRYGNSYYTQIFSKAPGGSWALDTTGFVSTNYSFTYSIASDRQGYLYISGSYYSGASKVNARVMRRPIGGGAWVPDTTGLPANVNYFSGMGADKNGNMMGTAGGKLYRRLAGTWGAVPLPAQAAGTSIDKFSVDSSGAIFASFTDISGGRGIYFTTDGGTSWTFAGLDSLTINQLISYGDSTYASTNDGLYRLLRQAATVSSVGPVSAQPGTYALFQNYPNPFNPTTTISFQLPAAGHVVVKVFNILGQEIAVLADKEMAAGIHQIQFDASRFSSGIYFYRIESGRFAATRKLVLLK